MWLKRRKRNHVLADRGGTERCDHLLETSRQLVAPAWLPSRRRA
jgi:hypothetical protein